MFIKDRMSTENGLCNNSPVFLNNPTPFACANQNIFYNHGGSDPDGDSLVFSLTSCYRGNNQPVSYGPGISPTSPLVTQNGVTIDPATGALNFIPSQPQVGVLCVLVEEFRNGQKVGEVVRDIQFTVLNCTNTLPTLSGIDGSSDYSTTGTIGQQLCFDMESADVDADQSLTLSYNNALPSATFSATAGPRPVGTFCWTPTAAGTFSFTVTVADNFCPLVGQNTYTYTIVVPQAPIDTTPAPCTGLQFNVVSTEDLRCARNDGSAVLTASGGIAPYTYQVVNWATGSFFTNQTGIFNNLPAGDYGVWISDANSCILDCVGTGFQINGNLRPLRASVTTTDALCAGDSASATIGVQGGTAPYLFSLNGGSYTSNNVFTGLAAGSYQVCIVDANGCNRNVSFQVTAPTALQLALGNVVDASCGLNNGSVTLLASGGTAPYTLSLNGQSNAVAGMFGQLASGSYTAEVVDANGCSQNLPVQIGDAPGVAISLSATDPSCAGRCDASATVVAQGGTAPFTVQWSNGQSGMDIDELCAGSYTAELTDANGCRASASISIADPAPLDVVLASSVDPDCNQSNGQAVLQATGGTAPYSFRLANFSNASVSNNTSGSFGNLAAGQYAVQLTDANGCSQDCASTFSLEGCAGGSLQTGTAGTRSTNYMLLSPNPANSIAQISYSYTEQKTVNLMVIDANGSEVHQQQGLSPTGSVELNISQWSGAQYFVLLRDEQGAVLASRKLIVRR